MDRFNRLMGKMCTWFFPILICIAGCLITTIKELSITFIGITAIYYTSLVIDKTILKK